MDAKCVCGFGRPGCPGTVGPCGEPDLLHNEGLEDSSVESEMMSSLTRVSELLRRNTGLTMDDFAAATKAALTAPGAPFRGWNSCGAVGSGL